MLFFFFKARTQYHDDEEMVLGHDEFRCDPCVTSFVLPSGCFKKTKLPGALTLPRPYNKK